MSPEYLLGYLAIGALSGILAGLLGIGGGLVIVPGLLFSFRLAGFAEELVLHLALGTSLAVIIFNALSAIQAHQRRGAVRWDLVRVLSPGLLAGTLLGSLVAERLSTPGLQRLFGVFALLVGGQLLFAVRASGRLDLPGRAGQGLAGGLIGLVSALVGIGGGSMTVPYLAACRVDLRQAIATSSACGLPIALAGALGYLWTGWHHPLLPAGASGYLYWPALVAVACGGMPMAPAGAWLAHRLPVALLRRLLGGLLLLLGSKMLIVA